MSTSPCHTSVLGLELPSTQSNAPKTEMDQMLVGEARAQGNFCCVVSRGNGERELIKKKCASYDKMFTIVIQAIINFVGLF